MTVRDLVFGALRLIGAVDANASLTAQEAADGMEALNLLIGSLNTERLTIYTIRSEEFTLTGGQGSYTMGPGGNFNTARPVRIEDAKYKVGDQEYPLRVLNDQEWQSLDLRTLGGFPSCLHDSGAYPLAVISLWPVPSAADKVLLFTWKAISEFTQVTDEILLPPGYGRMLKYNLAVELAPEFNAAVPDSVALIARESKAAIKRLNIQPIYLECDNALLGTTGTSTMSDFLGGN